LAGSMTLNFMPRVWTGVGVADGDVAKGYPLDVAESRDDAVEVDIGRIIDGPPAGTVLPVRR